MSNLDRVGVDQNEFIKPSGLMKVFRDIEKSDGIRASIFVREEELLNL